MRTFISYLILTCCLLLVLPGEAQQLILKDSVRISEPVAASIDRLQNIYIADKNGSLTQYTGTKAGLVYSPQQAGGISLVEAWNPLKIFLFYEDFQEYVFLDRFLTASSRYVVPEPTGFAGIMTISQDNNLWVVDYGEFGLKKYNLLFGQYTITTPFNLLLDPDEYEITFIREYQNLVFLSDKNSGILIFDNLGNYLRKIKTTGVEHFGFYDSHLYFIKEKELVLIDIYSMKKNSLSLPKGVLYAFYYGTELSVITSRYLKRYAIK